MLNHPAQGLKLPRLVPDRCLGIWNARSIVNKLSFLQSLVSSKALDILCVTETWLSPLIFDTEIAPHNYSIFRRDRDSRGGGVLIAISNDIPSRIVLSCPKTELIVVEVFLNPRIILACMYVPPNSPDSYHNDVIDAINNLSFSCDVILCGDFNCPDINWHTLTASNHFSQSLCEVLFNLNLVQHISEPTHNCGNCLDLLISNCQDRFSDFSVDSQICHSISDHYLVLAYITSSSKVIHTTTKAEYLNYALANFVEIDTCFFDTDFRNIYNAENVDSAWIHLRDVILSTCKRLIPLTSKYQYNNPAWFNAEIKLCALFSSSD